MTDYGLDPKQFVVHIIRPVLQGLELWSPSAEVLVLGTALHESKLRYVDQIDRLNKPGPAYGLFQMESATHRDLHENYLRYNSELRGRVLRFASIAPDEREMWGNANYACAMCRVHYRRVKATLPPTNDAMAQARYHKAHYNTVLGKTKVEESVVDFQRAIEISAAA